MSGYSNDYRYYNNSARSNTQSQYQVPTSTSRTDRRQHTTSPAYGAYNRTNYDTSGAGQYPTYTSTTSQHQQQTTQSDSYSQTSNYQQSQPSRSSNYGTSAQPYYNQQPARQPSTSATSTQRSQHQSAATQSAAGTANYSQQRLDQTHRQSSSNNAYQPQQATSNQYSNVRAESSQRSNAAFVDPTQVYDNTHERRRQIEIAQAEADRAARAEEQRRAKAEAEERKRKEAEAAEAAQQERDLAEARCLASEAEQRQKGTGNKKKKKANTATDSPHNASKAKRKSKGNAQSDESQMNAAALTLLQTANASGDKSSLETAMKAMFAKMREFNQADPEMLSRLWQQERDEHLAKESTGETAASSAVRKDTDSAQASSSRAKPSKPSKSSKKTPSGGSVGSPPAPIPAAAVASPSAAAPVTPTIPAAATNSTKNHKGTVWPADKKAYIAESASKIIRSMPGNRGRTVAPSIISGILDTQPDYKQLCDAIEAHGVKVDRSQLAKDLVAAVPDVNRRQVNRTQPKGGEGVQTTPVEQTTEESLAKAEKRLMKGANVLAKPLGRPSKGSSSTTNGHPMPATSIEMPSHDAHIDPTLSKGLEAVKVFVDGQWVEPLPSASKSGKDRKTSKSQPPPPVDLGPQTKQDQARKRDFNDLIDLTQQLSDDDDPYDNWNPPAKRPHIDDEAHPQLPTPPEDQKTQPLSGLAAVQQLNSWRPQAPGAPTAQMPGSLDQGSAAASKPATHSQTITLPKDHPARNKRLAEHLDSHKAVRRNSYDIRTIAQDVLLAAGRHPHMRHLNAHLDVLRSLSLTIDNSADLSTFHWDLVDPGGPPVGSGAPPLPQPQPVVPIDIDADDEDSEDDSVLGAQADVGQLVGIGGPGAALPGTEAPRMGVGRPKKMGRPRMSEPGVRTVADREPKRRGRPPRHSEGMPSSSKPPATPGTPAGAMTYAALRDANAAASGEPKKRGRPVGWRKSMMADPSQYKGSGRPPKVGKAKSPSPHFQVFKCEWKTCKAELHNLVTLRAHLHKLHGKPLPDEAQPYHCHWKDCGRVKNVTDPSTGRVKPSIGPYAFYEFDAWSKHVEDKHINPIAWKLGDGPKGGVADNYESEVSESYMSDSQGRRITPRAVPPEDNGPSSSRKLTAAQKEAEQTRAEAEQRKRDIGPTVDRGGATLVTDKVRESFRDDDDVAMVMDENE